MSARVASAWPTLAGAALILIAGWPAAAPAQVAPTGDGTIYYDIGGGGAVRAPANPVPGTSEIGGAAELAVNYSCLDFDALASIFAAFEDAVELFENIDRIVAAGLAALPLYALQRANPGLYDLLQNGLLRAEESFQIATRSCQQLEERVARGKNPYEDWVVLSRGNEWKASIGAGEEDIIQVDKDIDEEVGEEGVMWACGEMRGGAGQEPIRLVADITRAGYNSLTSGDPCAEGGGAAGGGEDAPRLPEVFTSAEEAVDYTTEVVGDLAVRTTGEEPDAARAGVGLLPNYNAMRLDIQDFLAGIVDGETEPTLENLRVISAPQTVITRQVIEAIQERDPAGQDIFIGKLAGQIALERSVEKALLARRMLLAGAREPNIAATPATEQMQPFVSALERDIDELLFASRIRREVVSHTAAELLRDTNREEAQGRGLVAPVGAPTPIDRGGVQSSTEPTEGP